MKPQSFAPELDRGKLDELILYVCERSLTDDHFGKTKLNKILWMSEFHHYALWGETIAGATYIHHRHGPVLKDLDDHLRRLQDAGRLRVRPRDRFGKQQFRPIPLQWADRGQFSGAEIASVEDVIHETRGLTAAQISAISHAHPGYVKTGMGDAIPYAAALVPVDEDDDAELDVASPAYASTP